MRDNTFATKKNSLSPQKTTKTENSLLGVFDQKKKNKKGKNNRHRRKNIFLSLSHLSFVYYYYYYYSIKVKSSSKVIYKKKTIMATLAYPDKYVLSSRFSS